MLSLHNISSAAQAESYYQTVNDYYAADEPQGEAEAEAEGEVGDGFGADFGADGGANGDGGAGGEVIAPVGQDPQRGRGAQGEHIQSMFGGKGADLLNLGEFDKGRFSELLRGRVDAETSIGRVHAGGEFQHRPGWDATLSAPKSVSIMALVAGDERVIEAHHRAVAETIKAMEESSAYCRDNEGNWVKTDNLTVASFTHSASRNLDPQLHTHNVILNMTRTKEGRWRSLEPKAIYQSQKMYGAIYRAHLAHSLSHELGYQITPTENGSFEIEGVPKDLIKELSSRRQEIERIAKEKGFESAKGKEQAALMTRSSKQHASKATLTERWQEAAKEHESELKALVPGKRPAEREQAEQSPLEAALYDARLAIKHLSTYEAVITKEGIIEFALQHISGRYSPAHLTQALEQIVADKELLPSLISTPEYEQGVSYTTPAALRRETMAVNMMEQGQGYFSKPVLSERMVNSHLAMKQQEHEEHGTPTLNAGQAEGLKTILCGRDQFVGIQGYAGTGKTFMWAEAKALAESAGYKVQGFAPTGSAAEKLFEDSGIKSRTIDSFLYQNKAQLEGAKGRAKGQNEIWVIDESGLANARHIVDMMVLARKAGARVVFQGDGAQLGAIEWGKLFKILQQKGMKTAVLDEIMRQKDSQVREAVYSVLDKDYHKAMAALGERVTEHKEDRIAPLVEDWSKLSKEDRENALVVIPDLETRAKATAAMRAVLQKKGELEANRHQASTLKDARLSDPQKTDGRFYKAGMVVEFGRDSKALGVTKGERFVVKQSGSINEVVLVAEDGRELKWNPSQGSTARGAVDVYKESVMDLAVGDRVKWTKTIRDLGLRNGDTGRITAIDANKNTATIEWKKGKETITKVMDLSKDRHLDHNYVHTAFLSQGLDSKHVFTIAESWRRNLVNEKSFYVKLSRTKEKIRVYTDSKENLTKAVARQAEKTSALESQKGRRANLSRKQGRVPELGWVQKLFSRFKASERSRGDQQREAKALERASRQKAASKQHEASR